MAIQLTICSAITTIKSRKSELNPMDPAILNQVPPPLSSTLRTPYRQRLVLGVLTTIVLNPIDIVVMRALCLSSLISQLLRLRKE
jgi:hypothetical protein